MTAAAPLPAASPFGIPIFRDMWVASLVSNFGGLIQSVGAAWLMASIAASPEPVALVQASTTLPIMLFSLVAGALADSVDRRLVMLGAQVFLFTISVVLTVFAWFGWLSPWLLLAFTFLMGCGAAFNGPAWQSLVGDMVPRPMMPQAIAFNSMGFNIARSVGPAIGGFIVAAAGAFAAFAVNTLTYIGLIFVLSRWRPERAATTLPREPLGQAMASGLRYVAMSPNILTVLARGAVFGVAAAAAQALMPIVARDLVTGGPATYGLLLGSFGVGAVGGAYASRRLRAAMSLEGVVRAAFLGFALAMVVVGLVHVRAVSMLAMGIAGACWVLALSTFNASVQMSSPRWVVGRTVALYQMATFGGMALGSWLWGAVAARAGAPEALIAAAAVLLVGAAIGLQWRLPEIDGLNLDPLGRWQAPNFALDIQPSSGPIVITVDYRIREEDIPEFLSIMAERRRIRIRDGARRWTLLRDLEQPELWVERYHLPTWTEYVRHHQRMTVADAPVRERLTALHQDTGEVRVHRRIERQTGGDVLDPVRRAHPAETGTHPLDTG
jgi:MFS family permease